MTEVAKVIFIAAIVAGCATTPVTRYSALSGTHLVEEKELPARPDSVEIPKDKDWVLPLQAGQCTEKDGILLSVEKAARAKQWQNGYNEIRSLYDLDRMIWVQHRIIYNERSKQEETEIERLQPTWWSDNKGTIGMVTGFIAGAVVTISIVYAVDQVKQ